MKRILILVLLALVSMCVNTQGQTYVNVQKSITITGNGSFAGTRDNGKLYRYNTVSTGSFYIETQLKSVSDGTKTVAGVGFRNENSPVTLDGSRPSAFIMYSNGKLKAQYRATAGGTYTTSSEVSVTLPCWVRVEKSGNDIVFKYSTTNKTNYQTLTTASGTASTWANIVQSLAIGSSNTTKDKAVFASLGYGSLANPIPACDCGFTVESVTQLTATTGQFTFNSCSVTSLNWKLKNASGTIVSNGTATITNSATIPFTIPSGTVSGTYTLEATPVNCTGTGSKTFSYTATTTPTPPTPAPDLAWVEYPNGQYVYDTDGSIVAEQLRLSLSGTQNNVLNILAPGFGCPSDRTASYSIDEGFYTVAGNSYGWISGIPSNITLVPDGRVHTLTIACVGDIWGEGSNKGITNVVMQYFKVGGNPAATITPDAGLTYIQYPSTFQPSMSSMLRQTTTQFPDFELPTKYNATLYGFPKSLASFDLTKRGWRYWGYNSTIPATKRYWLDPDSWAGGARDDAGVMDDATALQATSWGESLANTQGGNVRGQLVADGEWRGLNFLNAKGLNNSYYFWKKVRELVGNNAFIGEHQAAPYITPATWNRGELSLSDLSVPLGTGVSANTIHNLNNHPQAQYWSDVPTVEDTDIPNIPAGTRAGDFMDIIVNGYVSNYNSTNAYNCLWSAYVNKKFWGTKKVQVVIEGFNEVSVYGDRFGQIIRSWKINATKGAAIFELPPLSASSNENIAIAANFAADGIQDWRSTGNQNDSNPEYYHCNNPYRGCTQIAGSSPIGETYPTTWNGSQDYITAALYKMSQVPSDIIQGEKFFYEISLDNKKTWITGIDLNPLNAEKMNRPTVLGMKNSTGTKHAILAIFQKNNPTQQAVFYIRHPDFGVKQITLNGQFPELIIAQ